MDPDLLRLSGWVAELYNSRLDDSMSRALVNRPDESGKTSPSGGGWRFP